MRIFLLGSTGNTGHEILRRLIAENHEIVLLVRNLAKLDPGVPAPRAEMLSAIQGEVSEPEKLREHFKGCDVIVSALGTGTSNSVTDIYSVGGRNILNAMRVNNVRKLITITSAAVDLSDPSTDNFFMNRIIRPSFNKVYYDQTRWETILDETLDIDWICVRPPNLLNKQFTGKYRVNLNHCPKGGWKIARADLADFIVKQLKSDEYVHRKPVIAY